MPHINPTVLDTGTELDFFGESPSPHAVLTETPAKLSSRLVLKLLCAEFSFFFAGTNDGSLGPLVPYILRTYKLGTGSVSIIYAASFSGWVLAAVTNSHMVKYFGTGTILGIGAALQLLAQLLRFWGPPFGLFATSFFMAALGIAYQDSLSNTFVTTVHNAYRWLGFIHAMYALGALVSPFVATAISSAVQSKWSIFYLFLVGLGVVNLIVVLYSFWDSVRFSSIHELQADGQTPTSRKNKDAIRDMEKTCRLPVVWLLSFFFFFGLVVGITSGGWLVEYLVDVQNGRLDRMGNVPAALWGGIFLGRLLLAEPTHRYGEKPMLTMYCFLILAMQLVFWLVPHIVASAVSLSILGFFFGPLFATGVSVGSKLFPEPIRPTALGFVFVLAQAGGAIFPAITGLIASEAGVGTMQPLLIGLIVATTVSWVSVPTVPRG